MSKCLKCEKIEAQCQCNICSCRATAEAQAVCPKCKGLGSQPYFLCSCTIKSAEAPAADVGELPPLPERELLYPASGTFDGDDVHGYTADQMRDYARAALKGKKP